MGVFIFWSIEDVPNISSQHHLRVCHLESADYINGLLLESCYLTQALCWRHGLVPRTWDTDPPLWAMDYLEVCRVQTRRCYNPVDMFTALQTTWKVIRVSKIHIDVPSDVANSTTSLGETPGYIPHKPQTWKWKNKWRTPPDPTRTPYHAKHATRKEFEER